jgi:hypothetical protein
MDKTVELIMKRQREREEKVFEIQSADWAFRKPLPAWDSGALNRNLSRIREDIERLRKPRLFVVSMESPMLEKLKSEAPGGERGLHRMVEIQVIEAKALARLNLKPGLYQIEKDYFIIDEPELGVGDR